MENQYMLTDREARILDFEAHHRLHAGRKEKAISETFGLRPSRYYQLVNALIDREDALRADPWLVHRMRDERTARVAARGSGGVVASLSS